MKNYINSTKSVTMHCTSKVTIDILKNLYVSGYVSCNLKSYASINENYVVVIGGGISSEREISLMSAVSVINALLELNYKVSFIDARQDIATVLSILSPTLVFNVLHGGYGEDGSIAGLLDIMQIPYTSTSVFASSITFDKYYLRQVLKSYNIDVAPALIIKKEDCVENYEPMPRPFILKPLTQGSSIGIMLVSENCNFSIMNYEFPFGESVIIEEYIYGKEIQVVLLNGLVLGALEIKLLNGKKIFDYEAKYTAGFYECINIDVFSVPYKKLLSISERISNNLNLIKGVVRIELIYSANYNKYYVIEVNTSPGMSMLSIVPKIAKLNNLSYNELVYSILNNASFKYYKKF